jgi:hypothetical protein
MEPLAVIVQRLLRTLEHHPLTVIYLIAVLLVVAVIGAHPW